MDLLSLPTELIVMIFEHLAADNIIYLYDVEQVCIMFRYIVHSFRWNSTIKDNTLIDIISRIFLHYKFLNLIVHAQYNNPLPWFFEPNYVTIYCDDNETVTTVTEVIKRLADILQHNSCKKVDIIYEKTLSTIYKCCDLVGNYDIGDDMFDYNRCIVDFIKAMSDYKRNGTILNIHNIWITMKEKLCQPQYIYSVSYDMLHYLYGTSIRFS